MRYALCLLPCASMILSACGGEDLKSKDEKAHVEVKTEKVTPKNTANETASAHPEDLNVEQPDLYGFKILQTYPHGASDFTQGLFFADGVLYETTGRYGQSQLIRHDLFGGATEKRQKLPDQIFGEGAVAIGDKIISLTWRSGIGIIHDKESLVPEAQFPIGGEGWGLTYDGQNLILSDGSARLRFIDPATYQDTKKLDVTLQGKPVDRLNELEYINGEIWANLWQMDYIVRIDPKSGKVTAIINLAGINDEIRDLNDEVLNGIAYDPSTERLLVTGKHWSKIYEIELIKMN